MPDAGTCFFCGSAGKLTREHIWRDKWKKHYGSERFTAAQWGWHPKDGERNEYDRQYSSQPFSQTLRAFCEPCNTGWMNDLENAVESTILELAAGKRVDLDHPSTETLVRWAAKTAFVIAATDSAERTAVSSQQKADLLAGKVPAVLALWILPLPRSEIVHHWSTAYGVPVSDGGYANFRVTSWDFMAVHFLVTHSDAADPVDAPFFTNFQWILGKAVTKQAETWTCPPPSSAARPDVFPDYHAGFVRHFKKLMQKSGKSFEIGE